MAGEMTFSMARGAGKTVLMEQMAAGEGPGLGQPAPDNLGVVLELPLQDRLELRALAIKLGLTYSGVVEKLVSDQLDFRRQLGKLGPDPRVTSSTISANTVQTLKPEGDPSQPSLPPVGEAAESPISRPPRNRRVFLGDGLSKLENAGGKNLIVCEHHLDADGFASERPECNKIAGPGWRLCREHFGGDSEQFDRGVAMNRDRYLQEWFDGMVWEPGPPVEPGSAEWRAAMLELLSD